MAPPATPRPTQLSIRPLPGTAKSGEAFFRLSRERALHTLVRGALPLELVKRLLAGTMPRHITKEMPPEVWGSLAVSLALEDPEFGLPLAQALHDRLAWDREPADLEEWQRLARERPLEALWMGALSEWKPLRKTFARLVPECLRAFRASPQCVPPSWEFTDGILDVHAALLKAFREAEKKAEDAERRYEAERQRLDDLRAELKQLRRETSDLRGEKAQAERRAQTLAAQARTTSAAEEAGRIEELERRLRRSEKEREHLRRETEQMRAEAERLRGASGTAGLPPLGAASAAVETETPAIDDADEPAEAPGDLDPNPRRRLLRQIVKKLFNKGKIGGSHTHEDNVYRGVPDHEKGLAKEVIDLLYREGLLVPKPTVSDPHVSLSPDRTGEVRAILAGQVTNPRLSRFVEGRG